MLWTWVIWLGLESQICWLSTQHSQRRLATWLWHHWLVTSLGLKPFDLERLDPFSTLKIIQKKLGINYFSSQQTINFQQISINLHFQGKRPTGLTASQCVLDIVKLKRAGFFLAYAYKDCVVCNTKWAATCRTCGSRISNKKKMSP